MISAVTIVSLPPTVNPQLAHALVGCTVTVQPELFELTNDIAIGVDEKHIFLRNRDLRSALESTLGEGARQYCSLLPVGRATRVPKSCCEYHYTLPITEGLKAQ